MTEIQELRKEIRKTANGHGMMLLLFYGLIYGFAIFAALVFPEEIWIEHEDAMTLVTYLFQYVVAVPLIVMLFCGMRGFHIRESFRKPDISALTLCKWLLISLGVVYASAYISNILFTLLQSLGNVEFSQPDFAAKDTMLSRLTNLIAMILLAPFFEETFFRGTMYSSAKQYGSWTMIVCGVLFGLWHINYAQMIYAAVLGVVTCMLVAKTGSVFPGMLLHMIMNTIGAVQSLFMGDLDLERVAEMDMGYIMEHLQSFVVIFGMSMLIMLLVFVGILLLILELCNHKETFQLEKEALPLSAPSMLRTYLTAPLMVLALLAMVVLTVLRAMGIL